VSAAVGTTWPIPAPGDIASRCAAVYEAAFPPNPALGSDGIDARNPNTIATTNCRIVELAMLDLYYYQGNIAVELMPDTAVANLSRFGAIWGVPQDQPAKATGNVIVTGTVGVAIPSNIIFSYPNSNYTYKSTAGGTIGSGGTLSVPVVAQIAGTASNVEAGTQLKVNSVVGGLTSQLGVVDAGGIAGGLDLESNDSWRSRILARIRRAAMGGCANDYETWVNAALPGVGDVSIISGYGGLPNVGVVFAMAGPVVPTSGQIATVQAYLDQPGIKPVTAVPVVLAAVLHPVACTVHLSPDTPTLRTAVTNALALCFQQNGAINGTITFASLENAIASVVGSGSYVLSVPSADVPAPSVLSINTLGAVTFI
jgi:uncharacterized phage protein gp47/JayE